MPDFDIETFQRRIGYRFKDEQLLRQALMHSSYVNEVGIDKKMSNERLEFLGDAVIELTVSSAFYEMLPEEDEGTMSRLRSSIVRTAGLARIGETLGLGEALFLGKGADMGGERTNPTVLENCFEALAGAIYLDRGYKRASRFVYNAMKVSIYNAIEDEKGRAPAWDSKTALQIKLQKNGPARILYKASAADERPADIRFKAGVYCKGKLLGEGYGKSKKDAEKAAAAAALADMNVVRKGQ